MTTAHHGRQHERASSHSSAPDTRLGSAQRCRGLHSPSLLGLRSGNGARGARAVSLACARLALSLPAVYGCLRCAWLAAVTSPRASALLPVAEIITAVLRELGHLRANDPTALLRPKEAAAFLAISLRALQSRADIPRVDMSPPGSERAMWRYRRADLEQLIAMRTIASFHHEPAA